MAIPSSEPGKFKSAGSTGVQVDIGIGSNVFDAIAGAGRAFDKLKEESQKSVDTTNSYKTGDLRDQLGKLIQEDITNNGIQNDPDKWSESIESTISAWDERYSDATKGSSKEASEAFMFAREKAVRDARTKFGGKAIAQLNENEKTQAVSRSNTLVENGEVDAAIGIIEQSDKFSDAEKTIHKDKITAIYVEQEAEIIDTRINEARTTDELDPIREELPTRTDIPKKRRELIQQKMDSRARTLFNAKETESKEQYESSSFQDGMTTSGIDALEESAKSDKNLGPAAKLAVQQGLAKRRKAIEANDKTQLTNDVKAAGDALDAVGREDLMLAIEANGSIKDPEVKRLVVDAINKGSGTIGPDDEMVTDIIEDLEWFTGSTMGGWKARTTPELRKRFEKAMASPNVSMKAKMNMGLAAIDNSSTEALSGGLESWLSLDEKTGRMEWQITRDGVGSYAPLELDRSQELLIKQTSNSLNSATKSVFDTGDWTESTISASGLYRVYEFIHREDVLKDFEGLSDKEFEDKWNSKFIGTPAEPGVLKRETNNSINMRYRKFARTAGVKVKVK